MTVITIQDKLNSIIIYMKSDNQPYELISFLQNENTILKEDIQNSKDLLKLNREALKIAIAPRQGEEQLPTLISLLFQENTKLLTRCNALSEELESKSCQALISEQIATAYNEHEKYVASQLKDRLKILKKDVQAKENKISEMIKQLGRKQRREDTETGEEIAVVEYTDVTKISQRLFKQAESLRRELQNKGMEITKLRQQKDELIKLNLILTRQVNELKMYTTSQSTVSQKRSFNTSSSDLSKFMKYQSKLAHHSSRDSDEPDSSDPEQNSDIDSNDEEEESFQAQKIQPIKKQKPSLKFDKLKLQNLKEQKEQGEKSLSKELNESKFQKNMKLVPKLQLKRAKEIQNIIVKKINNDEKKKSGMLGKDERSKKLQIDLEELRKKLGNQIIVKLKLERENVFLKKFINELENRNELLLKDKIHDNIEKNYERQRQEYKEDNIETLLDICRDVTLNERLRAVCKGKEFITCKKNIQSREV